ncbi:MAG TPA: CPBP family intramembrane glutamic endopeptidase [Saprospiraceae bacterium]|nr:CPBP family intramembrane glutamic endopeptidase [Saprospiraceae bacterium]
MLPAMELYDMNAWDHVVAGVICIFAPILAYSSRRVKVEEIQLEPEDKIKLYHSNAMLLIVFGLVVITLWRIPGRSFVGLGFEWPRSHPLVILMLVMVFLFYALDIFFQYGLKRWRIRTLEKRNNSLSFVPSDKNELLHFSFLALAAGIGEEIIFRGYLIHYLLHWTGNSPIGILYACLISSLLFAFLHGYQGIASMIKIFFISMLFAGIFVYSHSLLIVILIHTFIDLLSGWIGILLLKNVDVEKDHGEE